MIVASCCLFTACGDDDDYKAGAPAEGQGVFFSNTASSKINLDSKATSFDVKIGRSITGSATTVELTVEDTSGKFTIPTSVSFAADAEMAMLTIGYNPEELEYDAYAKITLSVKGEENTTPYGFSTYTFEVGIPAPWKSIGKATFSDAAIFEKTYQVELQQNENDPNQYRLVDPYSKALENEELSTKDNPSPYVTFKLLSPGDKVNNVTIVGKGLVYFDSYSSGFYNTTYSQTEEPSHPADFSSLAKESDWQYNRVTHYKEDGTPGVVQLAPLYYMDGVGALNYSQMDGVVTIIFPNYVLADYATDVIYTGQYTSPNGTRYAIANVTLGKDVESAKVVLIEGDDVEAAIAGIEDGSLEATEITEAGMISLPCYEKGVHTFVVVSYAKEEAQESAYTRFLVSTTVSRWNSLGMAQYTDAIVGEAYEEDNESYEVEIQENANTPGLYRLVNPYGKAFPLNKKGDWDETRDYYMEINATDPAGVYITVQNTGLNWGDGNLYVYSEAAYTLDEEGKSLAEVKTQGLCGTLNNGVITFPNGSLLFGFFESSSDFYTANESGDFKIVLPSAVTTNIHNAVMTKKSVNKSQVKLAKTPIQKRKDLVPTKVTLIK